MGSLTSFGGHAVPGGFFIIVALWWTIQFAYSIVVLENGRQRPRSHVMYCLHRAPIEAGLIVFAGIAGIVVEMRYWEPVLDLRNDEGRWQNDVTWGHCSMYLYFAIYGFVKVLGSTCVPSAAKFDHALGALAYAVEGFLFNYLSNGQSRLEDYLHSMLVFAIFACFLAAAAEAWYREDTSIRLIRILFTLVQGTWFWHLGIVLQLYKPHLEGPWDGDDELNVMFTTVIFIWHIFIDMLVLFLVYGITKLTLKACGFSSVQYSQMSNGRDDNGIKLQGNSSESL